jgi:hypothetical protein
MSDVDSKIKQYKDKLKELKMAFQDRTILQTGIAVSRIMDNLKSLGELVQLVRDLAFILTVRLSTLDYDLGDMPYAKGVRFDPDKGCLPGTREAIIKEITHGLIVLMETMSLGYFS